MKIKIDFNSFPDLSILNNNNNNNNNNQYNEEILKLYNEIKEMCDGVKSTKSNIICNAFTKFIRSLKSSNGESSQLVSKTLIDGVLKYLKSLTDNNPSDKGYLLVYISVLVGSGFNTEDTISILEERIISGTIEPFPSIVKLLNRAYSAKQRACHVDRKSNPNSLADNRIDVKGTLKGFYSTNLTESIDKAKEIKQISFSKKGFIILYTDGTITCKNNQPSLQSKAIAISSGQEISMALTSNGTVISWGLLTKSLSGSFTQISAGHSHCTAIDSMGRLFTWGVGCGGRLGHGLKDTMTKDPTMVSFFKGRKLSKVAAGRFHTVVLTNQGEVYTMGQNYRFQLGYDDIQIPTHNEQIRAAIDTYIPESSIASDFKGYFNSEINSDLTITFSSVEKVYVHYVMLTRINSTLSTLFKQYKKDGIQKIESTKFFNDVYNLTKDDTQLLPFEKEFNESLFTMNNFLNFIRFAYGTSPNVVTQSQITPFCDLFKGNLSNQIKEKNTNSQVGSITPSFPESTFTINDPLSDVHLIVTDPTTGNKTTYFCHRIVLCSRSMGFSALLKGGKGDEQQPTIQQIEIKPQFAKVLPNFLRYIYYDSFKLDQKTTSGNDILHMIQLCNEYRVERLKSGCEKLVIHSADITNVIQLLQFAIKNEANSLISYCVDYINLNKQTFTDQVVQEKLPLNVQSHINAKRYYNVLQGGQYTPRQIDYFKQHSIFVSDIEAGDKMSIAHDEAGNVYQIGIGSNHTPGHPIISKFNSELFTGFSGTNDNPRIETIKVGSSHGSVLLENNQLYSWGAGFLGQVGERNIFYPAPIKLDNSMNLNSIAIGPYATVLYNDHELKEIKEDEKKVKEEAANATNHEISQSELDQFFETLKPKDGDDADDAKVLIELFTDNRKSYDISNILGNKDSQSITSSNSSRLSDEESSSNVTTRKLYVDLKILPESAQKLMTKNKKNALRIYGYNYQSLQTVIYFLYHGKVSVEGENVIETIALATLLGVTPLYYKLSGMVNQMMSAELAVSIHKAYLSNPFTKSLIPSNIACSVGKFIKYHKSLCSKYL